MIAYLVPPQKR